MRFFILPDGDQLAFVPRTGSTAWANAIINKYYPELKTKLDSLNTPLGRKASPQFILPATDTAFPDAVHLVIRDSIERFKSGFTRSANGKSVDQVIDDLLTGKTANIHIRRLTDQFSTLEGFKMYRWEFDLEQLAFDLGLDGVPPIENESGDGEKPILTDSQISKLKLYYADDISIYDSIVRGGLPLANKSEGQRDPSGLARMPKFKTVPTL